jgi:hypothetical protein
LPVAIEDGSLGRQPWNQRGGPSVIAKAVYDVTFLWILLAIIYVACWLYFGLTTFRKGHFWMFWIGFFFPILWIVGALIAPTPRAAGIA